MMTNVTDIASVPAALPARYDLFAVAFGSGPTGLWGWLALSAVPVAAVVVIVRHLTRPTCHVHGTAFFQVAHVCSLIFLCNVVVCGHIIACLCHSPTPDAGLNDFFVGVKGKVAGLSWNVVYHDFKAESGSVDFGRELDISLGYKIAKNYGILIKSAFFNGDKESTYDDTTKFWLQATANF